MAPEKYSYFPMQNVNEWSLWLVVQWFNHCSN